MNIKANGYFMGAYWQRTVNQNAFQLNTNKIGKIAEKLEKMGFREEPATLLSLSEEAKMLLGQAGADKLQADTEELYQKDAAARAEYGDNEFAVNGNDQWIVFSKYLYDHGFYDDMSDEDLENAEHVLMQITDGMDSVFSSGHRVGIDLHSEFQGEQLDSQEARLELESSTAALRYFSDNLLDSADKAGFDALIDKYYTHNSEILDDGYASIEEKFNRAISRLPDAAKRRAARERLLRPDSRAAEDWALRNILGGTTHSTEETKEYGGEISDLFAGMNRGDQASILRQAKDVFLRFAANGSDNKAVAEFVEEHAEDVFDRIQVYWSGVTKIDLKSD